MNILQAMKQAKASEQNNKINVESNNVMMESENSEIGVGFSSGGGGLQPLQPGPITPYTEIRDLDHDGIPDHMDYHWGPGQF